MSWLPLSFGAPMVLWGLVALPVIWWLLRFTPPQPQKEVFPPLKILARVLRSEDTPNRSPWWLTLLRLLMAGLVIFALADPVWNPRERIPVGGSLLALVVDNGWASAPDWNKRVATAERLINDAEKKEMPIILAFTAEKANQQIGPYSAGDARSRLNAVQPRPVPVDREGVFLAVANTIGQRTGATIALLTDGLAAKDDDKAFATLLAAKPANIVWAAPDRLDMVGLTAADNGLDRFSVTAIRAPAGVPRAMTAGAFDEKGRRIGDAALTFRPGEAVASGEIVVPFELRNDFAAISLDGENHAAGVRLLDGTAKRRRVALLSQAPTDDTRQLLSPLYYIRRALEPSADIIEPKSPDLQEAIPQLLEQKPAVIVLGDVGTVPDAVREPLIKWMQNGGTLIRFASTRLLTAGNDDELLPVKLRLGERLLGGALSWTEPQKVTEFPSNGPFAKLAPPQDVTVSRQILAEPTPTLAEHTWATLADGTPLVTADSRGKGIVVLFHITPSATWSNLPISGSFVEMLRAIVQLSRNQGAVGASTENAPAATLPPYRMIGADGQIGPPSGEAKPLQTGKAPLPVTIENPPGLYGTENGVFAHNLLPADATLAPISRPTVSIPVVTESYAVDEQQDIKGPLLFAALALLIVDGLVVLWLTGLWRRAAGRMTAAAVALIILPALFLPVPPAFASDAKPGDQQAIDAATVTRIAYVLTGNSSIDAVSRAGMGGLTRFLREKTALEPGDPTGVNIESDDLAFYPLIYWPVDANVPVPSQSAIARIDEYMKNGGTVLFDTRDQFAATLDASASPATQRLRDILGTLNVPPLEPVPSDHVLTKSFYILNEFPGRYAGSPLWVEASLEASNPGNRPVRTGDGVTPIMITSNDFAGAWAEDENGNPLFPTVPSDPMQRIYAFRAGVNIIMYMLTGNYKSDQVHVPDLLERLGQ
ncbi:MULTISPECIES: DUF4159 domain-containing protein [Phyllobacteriaceae]|jgi:Domain of unknown function (DUF4159)/Aerotolerance regulator N-terminal|uniref:RNA-binding protein n=1 Tax=Mesorhizobium hungaricum TaxID=1566387 RepID=A0A1C2EEX1_9HYPH|nr:MULTISPECIES: DUF4159 domain-containing protein [Mesorhizobium]MBN9237559.1 DUF4159 domain-containing protein [Mesorhizobium sp.]MDQ0329090.1 hypothetical protein [Mesorhizobium sp. YL-MeA3-2017]OCX25456.1 RNA-binding protein [Mesorhizobium hungaricum]